MLEVYASGGARAFFSAHYANAEDRKSAVLRASRVLDPRAAAAIEAQNAQLSPSPARDKNIALLKSGAAAVVTGQQMGLFLGPLYTVYKAATAIKVARAMAEESGRPVVPIFWLQTEDHDLPEIASCFVPGTNGSPLELSVPCSHEDRRSVAHRTLPIEVTGCLDMLRDQIQRLPHGPAHWEKVARHYREGTTYSRAFTGLLAELFADEGLVFVDPRDPELAVLAAPLHKKALSEAAQLSRVLLERVRALAEAGFLAMVHVREGAPLSFYHPVGAEGPRYRLEPVEGGFREIGGERTHTLDSLLAALDRDPLLFSTSALLRPLLQDSLLPTAAYIGGPGEVAYFAQLEPLYRAFGLSMPVIVPRARFRIVEEKTLRLLARLGVSADQATSSEDALLSAAQSLERAPFHPEELEAGLNMQIGQLFDEVASKIEGFGPGLDSAIDKTRASIRGAIGKLREKYEKAVLHRDQALVEEVRRLKAMLQPNGDPQERIYGISYYAARYGEREFIDKVMEAIVPYDASQLELRP